MQLQTLDLSLVSFVILLIILKSVYNRTEVILTSVRLFVLLILFNLAIIIVDIFGWVFNGLAGELYFVLNTVFNLLLYIIEPIGPSIWILYVIYQVFQDEKKIKHTLLVLCIPFLINALLSIVSLKTGWFFTVDANNIYYRGTYFWLHVMYCYGLLIYSFIYIIIHNQKLNRSNLLTMLAYFIPQIIGTSIQVLYYGVSYNWVGLMVSILIIYINMQNRVINTDYLTGIYNRRQIDAYFKAKIRRSKANKTFAAIMIDLKNFKQINDQFGHDIGDIALKDSVTIMRTSLRKDDFIARYGGDEFIIIIDNITDVMLHHTIQRIQGNIDLYNQSSRQPFILAFSMGYAIYDINQPQSVDLFLKHLDTLMYNDKQKHQTK